MSDGKKPDPNSDDASNETLAVGSHSGTGGLPSQSKSSAGGETLKLPNYQIEKKLGEGGMGAVYRARQNALNRTVAIKVLPERLSNNQSYVARLNREAMALAKLHHPNIIMCYDMGEHQGNRYVVMEFVEGENLGSLIDGRKTLPEREALFYLKQAVIGLDHALAAGIIHRDIKPENMLLAQSSKEGTISRLQAGHTLKIADLGLAAFTGEGTENTRLTVEGSTIGSPHYMSPEQTIGDSNLDFRTDIYALGITLFHMVTGKVPFQAPTVGAVLAKKLSELIPDPRSINKDISPGISLLIQRMTAKDKNDRYASYAELLADIEALERGQAPKTTVLSDDRAGMKLLPETVSALRSQPASKAGAEGTVKTSSGGKMIVTAVVITALIAAVVLGSGLVSSKTAQHNAPAPFPVPVINSVSKTDTSTDVAVTTKPAISTNTDTGTGTTKPTSFEPQFLVEEKFEKLWKTSGDGRFFWNDEDGAICLEELKGGWISAEHPLPADEYLLHVKLDTTQGVDNAEVQIGIGKKEYVACGIQMLKGYSGMSAYIERREVGTNKAIIDRNAVGDPDWPVGLQNKQEFFIRVAERVVTCKVGKQYIGAVDLREDIKPVLRIAVKKGIGRFFAIDLSPLAPLGAK